MNHFYQGNSFNIEKILFGLICKKKRHSVNKHCLINSNFFPTDSEVDQWLPPNMVNSRCPHDTRKLANVNRYACNLSVSRGRVGYQPQLRLCWALLMPPFVSQQRICLHSPWAALKLLISSSQIWLSLEASPQRKPLIPKRALQACDLISQHSSTISGTLCKKLI